MAEDRDSAGEEPRYREWGEWQEEVVASSGDRRLPSRAVARRARIGRTSRRLVHELGGILSHPGSRAAPLALLVAWAPLPFGSVTPHATMILRALGFVVLALSVALAPRPRWSGAARGAVGALLALVVFGWFQTLPLPAALAARLDPPAARAAAENAGFVAAAPPARVALSLAPRATRDALGDWILAAVCFASGYLCGGARRARRVLLGALVATGLFEVFFGAQLWFARADELWGEKIPGPTNRLRGTFVNANHLATYLAILCAVALAWVWWSLRRATSAESLEERIRAAAVPGVVWVALFVGLAFTGSRAGMLATLAGAATEIAIVFAKRRRRTVVAALAALLLVAVGTVAAFSFQAGFGRLLATGIGEGPVQVRLLAARRTLELWREAPVTGIGIGAFRAAFPTVQDATIPDVWWHAHNGWVELLASAGLAGFALFVAGLVALGRGLARVWREGRTSEDRAAALAAAGALVAVGVQELGDFGITMPATAATLALLCGAALAAALRESSAAPVADRAGFES